MFNTHPDRGRILLAVRVYSVGWTVFLWAVVIVWASLTALALLKPHDLGRLFRILPSMTGSLFAISGYVLYPRIKFYEGGVEIPPTRDYSRMRYLRWDQIERSSWDGDRLVLTGTNSVLAGGPLDGGTVRIPKTDHSAVDQVLGTKLAVR